MKTYINLNKVMAFVGTVVTIGGGCYLAYRASKKEQELAEQKKEILNEVETTSEIRKASMKNSNLDQDDRVMAKLELDELFEDAKFASDLDNCRIKMNILNEAIDEYLTGTEDDIKARIKLYSMQREDRKKKAEISTKNAHEMSIARYKADSDIAGKRLIADAVKDAIKSAASVAVKESPSALYYINQI